MFASHRFAVACPSSSRLLCSSLSSRASASAAPSARWLSQAEPKSKSSTISSPVHFARRAFSTNSSLSASLTRALHGDDTAGTSSCTPMAAEEVRALVGRLETMLRLEEQRRTQQAQALAQVEQLRKELAPLERAKAELDARSQKRANYVMWAGLAYMGFQFGLLARLTWWDYSWDIVEPITYFVTYGTGIFFYCYYIVTRDEHTYLGAEKRQQLFWLHKLLRSKKSGGSSLDLSRYNQLRSQLDAQLQQLATLGASADAACSNASGAGAGAAPQIARQPNVSA